ncbi:MAG: hypothetical protein AAF705_13425, partial [Bacteroidota bacterium]
MISSNLNTISKQIAELENRPLNPQIVDEINSTLCPVQEEKPSGYIGGIDSSDNLLLNIPDHPGAAIAGYSFSLVISNAEGSKLLERKQLSESPSDDFIEDLQIELVHNVPLKDHQRLARISDYQFRSITPMPRMASPYNFDEIMPELKVRLMAARNRELTERQAIMNALYQPELVSDDIRMNLLLKDGRLSSQNVQPGFMDEIGRSAVEQGVRLVGFVKMGTLLWSSLYPYHSEIYKNLNRPYWSLIPPSTIIDAYAHGQYETKTLRLGASENRSLGGIGGAWVMYGNGPRSLYLLEFNVYDLQAYKHLVIEGTPIEAFNKKTKNWSKGTFVVDIKRDSSLVGTQNEIS